MYCTASLSRSLTAGGRGAMQHFLNFRPLPQGQASFLPGTVMRASVSPSGYSLSIAVRLGMKRIRVSRLFIRLSCLRHLLAMGTCRVHSATRGKWLQVLQKIHRADIRATLIAPRLAPEENQVSAQRWKGTCVRSEGHRGGTSVAATAVCATHQLGMGSFPEELQFF